jgi:integrase
MPRHSKGPHLWLRPAQFKDGRQTHAAVWHIVDRKRKISTGCSKDDREGSTRKLEEYLAQQRVGAIQKGPRHPNQIYVADVLALYTSKKAPKLTRQKECLQRVSRLLDYFQEMTLADLNADVWVDYMEKRAGSLGGKRELEDLRAAINFHFKQGLCLYPVPVIVPPGGLPRERWLERDEVAKLVWHAWRFRGAHNHAARKHVARFILAAVYSTRRKGSLLATSLGPAVGRPWADLERGSMYGKKLPKGHKKKQPNIAIPTVLLSHMRRWAKNGQRNVVEFYGEPITKIDRAFREVADACGFRDVCIHSLRHTGITWLAIEGNDPYEICKFAGITMKVFEDVYSHHHPDYMTGIKAGMSKHRQNQNAALQRHSFDGTKKDSNVVNITKKADNG